jgi:hypothetical protein
MKVTSNLSFLLGISSMAMPGGDARANGFGINRSAATKRSIEHRKAFDAAVVHHNKRRSLETKEECEDFFKEKLGDVGCTCTENGDDATDECYDDIINLCTLCDTLEDEITCQVPDLEASATASSVDVVAECYTYTSGKFDNTICSLDNTAVDTCSITIDGTECKSCAVVACSDEEDDTLYDFDCSNIIGGETWNLCTDDIPETSRFIAYGDNDRFSDFDCIPGSRSGSGAFALSFHAFSVVGLIVVATFW